MLQMHVFMHLLDHINDLLVAVSCIADDSSAYVSRPLFRNSYFEEKMYESDYQFNLKRTHEF